jgi:hypothetical protein
MAVKEVPPLVWRTFAEGLVALSEEGAVSTQITEEDEDEGSLTTLTTTGVELTEGKHYWEVELLGSGAALPFCEGEIVDIDCYLCFDLLYVLVLGIFIGISRPNLDPIGITDGWFMDGVLGALWGNGKEEDDDAGAFDQGDRVGLLLDLGDGSLRFFKNGVQYGPGYAAGSVTGPVVAAVQLFKYNTSARLLPNAQQPE